MSTGARIADRLDGNRDGYAFGKPVGYGHHHGYHTGGYHGGHHYGAHPHHSTWQTAPSPTLHRPHPFYNPYNADPQRFGQVLTDQYYSDKPWLQGRGYHSGHGGAYGHGYASQVPQHTGPMSVYYDDHQVNSWDMHGSAGVPYYNTHGVHRSMSI